MIVVTGGLGFIGSAFIRSFAAEIDMLNVDIDTYAGDEHRLEGVALRTERLDVAHDDLIDLVGRLRPQAIVHFAAESHVTRGETDADSFWRTNVEGTRRVLEAAVNTGTSKVVHISTDEVYGPCLGDPFTEDDKEEGEGKATSAYARSKAVADDLAMSFSDRVPVVIARPTNCFGPYQHPEKAVARWTIRALKGEPLPVWGDGQQVRDWMFVDDACRAIASLLEKGEPGHAYNIAPQGSDLSNLHVARSLASYAGRDEDAVYLTAYDRPDHDRRYAVDSSKMRALGWDADRDIEARLEQTVAWYRDNEDWWHRHIDAAEAIYDDALESRQ